MNIPTEKIESVEKFQAVPQIKTLLWSLDGCGPHYNGPASFMYRLFNSGLAANLKLDLAHAYDTQIESPLFNKQHYIGKFTGTPLNQLLFYRKLENWIDQHHSNYDVIHAISAFHYGVVPAFRAEKLGLPSVIFVSNHLDQLQDKSGLKNILKLPQKRRKMLKSVTAVVALSTEIYEELVAYGIPEKNIARIPMGVDTTRFSPAGKDKKEKIKQTLALNNIPTVLFSGGIEMRKQPHLLLEALTIIRKQGYECQLVLLGPEKEADYCGRLRAQISRNNIAEHVIFAGFHEDPVPYYQAADIFCLPSANEGMAASIVEAMATAIPPILTPISGAKDLVESGVSGQIVSSDPYQIADAVTQYLNSESLRQQHGCEARNTVVKQFSSETVGEAYLSLYKNVCHGKDAASASIF